MPSASTPDFAGIVLAGGASSRMGSDKALLRTPSGMTLLHVAVATLRAAGARPVVISGDRPGYDCVADDVPFPGPLGGLACVLAARPDLHGRLLLLLPVDVPRIGTEALLALLHAAGAAPGACYDGHPLPLALHGDAQLRARLEALRAGRAPAAVHRLVDDFGMRRLPADGVDLTNLNTPADWQAFTG